MSRRRLSTVVAIAIFFSFGGCKPPITQPQDAHAVLLPESAARELSELCSREAPQIDGTWTPSAAVLATMEANLGSIADLESESGKPGVHIRDPRKAYRQYVGVVIAGQHYVYINGVCELIKPGRHWRKKLENSWCDGGECFWGVLYNVQSNVFSDLRTNGGFS